MRAIEYTQRAAADLESIALYLAVECLAPDAARSTVGQIAHAVEHVAEMPGLGREFSDSALLRGYRVIVAGNYRVFYTYTPETLLVHRIVHHRRDIDEYALVDL